MGRVIPLFASHQTATRLRAGYLFEGRGLVDVKRNGPMRPYLVPGRRLPGTLLLGLDSASLAIAAPIPVHG